MGFISELVLHVRSADNSDWHGIITGFHVANQNIASRKNIKRGTEGFSLFCSFFLVLFIFLFIFIFFFSIYFFFFFFFLVLALLFLGRVTESCGAKSIPGLQRSTQTTNNYYKPIKNLMTLDFYSVYTFYVRTCLA